MAIKLVKYKLIKFGNGYMCPTGIVNGGNVWEHSNDINQMILVGSYDVVDGQVLPEGILEVITEEQWNNRLSEIQSAALNKFKEDSYKNITDPLFIEALRDKQNAKYEKWDIYLKKYQVIHDLTEIPENGIIVFPEETPEQIILNRTIFSKLDIRRAMRVLGQEEILDGILASSPIFLKDWTDADNGINLNDVYVVQALESANININNIKLKILELSQI